MNHKLTTHISIPEKIFFFAGCLLLFGSFVISGSPTAQAMNDAAIDNLMANNSPADMNENYKGSKTTFEIAQLVYDAPTSSQNTLGSIRSKNNDKANRTWSSARYFPTVEQMLNNHFFMNFVEQMKSGLYQIEHMGGNETPIGEEFVAPTYLTLMGCDPCPGKPNLEPSDTQSSNNVNPFGFGSVPPPDNSPAFSSNSSGRVN